MKKQIIFIIAVLVIAGLFFIYIPKKNTNSIYIHKQNANPEAELMKCIASKTKLYIATGCSACARQKSILNNYIALFNITDCAITPEECGTITHVPTWIIGGKKYEGVRSIEKLKELTGC